MKKIEKNIAILYPCGVCNLQCRYCGIDKNPALKKIDDALGESFEDTSYYMTQFKKYFPNPVQFTRLETWGGEPMLKVERIFPLIHELIKEYPYFDSMYTSTNFSYSEWTDKMFGLWDQFGQHPERQFTFDLQLSMDGPQYINDINRGEGVTERCLNNFNKMLEILPNRLPDNIYLVFTVKKTLDASSVNALCDKQKIIEYYQFFEQEFKEKVDKLGMDNVYCTVAPPNTAVPSPITKHDGQVFAEFCRLTREIEKENQVYHYFKYYDIITPYDAGAEFTEIRSYECSSTVCGSGTYMIGFMPFNLISICHEGFTELYEDYKKYAQTSERFENGTIDFNKFIGTQKTMYCIDADRNDEYECLMECGACQGSSARLINITAMVMTLAMAGQIDEKYIDEREAMEGAAFLMNNTSYCIKDNYNITGSYSLVPNGLCKLLLNGAREYIEERYEYGV